MRSTMHGTHRKVSRRKGFRPGIEDLESRTLLSAYFVSTVGNDGWDGLTTGTAWRTIQKAANVVNPGDVVTILNGTYNEHVSITRDGTQTSPITFKKDAGATVTVASDARWGSDAGILLDGANHWVFDGINVEETTPSAQRSTSNYMIGYRILDSSDVTVQNAKISNTGASGVLARDTNGSLTHRINNITVTNNTIVTAGLLGPNGNNEIITLESVENFMVSNNKLLGGGREGICTKGFSRNGEVVDNTVTDLARTGIYVSNRYAYVQNVEVARNLVYHNGYGESGGGIWLSIEGTDTSATLDDIRVFNNVVYDNAKTGILITQGFTADGLRKNIQIVNNTVYNNGWDGTSEVQGGIQVDSKNIQNIQIHNNIAVNNRSGQIGARDDGSSGGYNPLNYITASYNIKQGTNYTETYYQWKNLSAWATDPKFVDPANRNLRLQNSSPASPAMDYGNSSYTMTDDFTGLTRVNADDAGAYDGGAALSATPSTLTFAGGGVATNTVKSATGPRQTSVTVNEVAVTNPVNVWDVQLKSTSISNVVSGDQLRVTFWAKKVSGTGQVAALFRSNGVNDVNETVTLGWAWQQYTTSVFAASSGSYEVRLNLGQGTQTVQIYDLQVVDYGQSQGLMSGSSQLPASDFSSTASDDSSLLVDDADLLDSVAWTV